MVDQPKFQARPHAQLGQGWCVHVTWPTGKTDTIAGFGNQYMALYWIKLISANWVADKLMGDPDYPSR